MTAKQPSWQEVARVLARQMEAHAVCDNHPPHADEPDTCPFCADRAAYAVWKAKARVVPAPPDPSIRSVRLEDIPLNGSMVRGGS